VLSHNDLIYNTYPLTPDDLACLQLHDLFVVQMQVATTNHGTYHLANNLLLLSDGRFWNLFRSCFRISMPMKRKHGFIVMIFRLVGGNCRTVIELLLGLIGKEGIHGSVDSGGY
jgi:hypothetical protein